MNTDGAEYAWHNEINPHEAQTQRVRKDCPMPDCKARSLLRLADHLRCTHRVDHWLKRSDLLKMVDTIWLATES